MCQNGAKKEKRRQKTGEKSEELENTGGRLFAARAKIMSVMDN